LFNRETAILDWARAIERNKDAMTGIIAALFAMLGLEAGATLGRISRELHRSVLRVLRPAESAVRRLIVIAARGLVLKPVSSRPMPKGRVIRTGGGTPRFSFQLFDTRKRFDFNRPRRIPDHKRPRIWVFDDTPPGIVSYRPEDFGRSPPAPPDNTVDARRLCLRLHALKLALEDLPRQAKRLVRLKARREALQKQGRPVFISPMRPGRPPGHREKPVHEVDDVLFNCHALARDAERPDTS
jgi:hypothetical protein